MIRNSRGITLIELLAVLVIIGMISAIAIPAVGGVLNSSRATSDINTEKRIVDAAKHFLLDYESSLARGSYAPGTHVLIDVEKELVFGGYLESMPVAQMHNGMRYLYVQMVKLENGNWALGIYGYDKQITAANRLTFLPSEMQGSNTVREKIGFGWQPAGFTELPSDSMGYAPTDLWYVPASSSSPIQVKVFLISP